MDGWIVYAAPLAGALILAMALGWLWRRQKAREAAIAAMAQRRGWSFQSRLASGGSAGSAVLAPAAPGTWRVTVTRAGRSQSGSRSRGQTEFLDPAGRWPGGAAVFGPPIPPKAAAMAMSMLGSLDSGLGRMLLNNMLGDAATDVVGLDHIPAPGGRTRAFTMLANVDDVPAHVLDRLEEIIAPWTRNLGADTGWPIIIVGPSGLRVRLRRVLHEASEFEAFADLAIAIRDLLAPHPEAAGDTHR